jgi:hypothetical protein
MTGMVTVTVWFERPSFCQGRSSSLRNTILKGEKEGRREGGEGRKEGNKTSRSYQRTNQRRGTERENEGKKMGRKKGRRAMKERRKRDYGRKEGTAKGKEANTTPPHTHTTTYHQSQCCRVPCPAPTYNWRSGRTDGRTGEKIKEGR